MLQFVVTTCKLTYISDNVVSLTQLTKIGVISAVFCKLLLEIALCELAFIDLTDGCMINSGTN